MANRHRDKCSHALTIGKMQPLVRFCLSPVRRRIIKKEITIASEDSDKRGPLLYTLAIMQTVQPTSHLTLCAVVMGSVCLCHCDCVLSDLYVISFIMVFKTSKCGSSSVKATLHSFLSHFLVLNPYTHKLYCALGSIAVQITPTELHCYPEP